MGRVFITGDTHGQFNRIEEFCNKFNTNKDDIMIILGDAGINYYLNKKDMLLKERLQTFPITLFCIHGNHEARPNTISSYKEKKWNAGTVYYEEGYQNILFAKDGQIYIINNKTYLTIGGAYSVDWAYRVLKGWQWFKDEQPDDNIKRSVELAVETVKKVDCVLSHTCPISTEPRHMFLSFIDQSTVDKSTEEWLQTIAEELQFKNWYFGHYHANWDNGKYHMLYEGYIEIGDE